MVDTVVLVLTMVVWCGAGCGPPFPGVQALRDKVGFAPHLRRAVDRLLKWKGPGFVAVHWRSEKMVESNRRNAQESLLRCARGLIDTVKELMKVGGEQLRGATEGNK